MNTTTRFERYFDTFSQMSMDDLLDHHSELYGLRWFADLDFEAEVQVFEELQALETYIYINFDIDLSECGDYSESYTIEDVEVDDSIFEEFHQLRDDMCCPVDGIWCESSLESCKTCKEYLAWKAARHTSEELPF